MRLWPNVLPQHLTINHLTTSRESRAQSFRVEARVKKHVPGPSRVPHEPLVITTIILRK